MKIHKLNKRKILWILISVLIVFAVILGILIMKENFATSNSKTATTSESLEVAETDKTLETSKTAGLAEDTKLTEEKDLTKATDLAKTTGIAETTKTTTSSETSKTTETTASNVQEQAITDNNEITILSKMEIASITNKIILVTEDQDGNGILSYYEKDLQENWKLIFTSTADLGKKGISNKKIEGDGKTPAGCYNFTVAFGINENPGALLEYKPVINTSYWVDDVNSPYYNQWADSESLGISFESEHLIDHNPAYLYALNIGYNLNCIPGEGSAIFLHCKNGKGYTTGCVAVELEYMKLLVQQVDANTKIVIAESADDYLNY